MPYNKEASCILQVTRNAPFLSGRGVLVAILDSGINYRLDEFRDAQGNTRILALWDQSQDPDTQRGQKPPEGFLYGTLYTQEEIQEQINIEEQTGALQAFGTDLTGHGTAVASIAAGTRSGVAPEATLLIVKLASPRKDGFPRTTEVMRAFYFAVQMGIRYEMPVAINLSFGNTYGNHRGDSLLERFIDTVSELGKTSIVIGSGNEGAASGHAAGIAKTNQTIELAVAPYETGLSIQYWKHYADDVIVRIVSPQGEVAYLETRRTQTFRRTLGNTQLLCFLGEPQPYMVSQEIFIDMIPVDTYIQEGIWQIEILPQRVVTGEYRMYLPSYAIRNQRTYFLKPTKEMTITIPSTSMRAITVGAYDVEKRSYADFSGRGYVYRYLEGRMNDAGIPYGISVAKPDLVAPGVNITVPTPQGTVQKVSGTSFAAPYVTGSAALLMEWGIIKKNDPYLYGEKVKAYLQSGAKTLPGFANYPNAQVGWGALCVRDSLPIESV